MDYIAPGVYTKISVLEKYVENIPSSTGFVVIISDKGKDNQLLYTSSKEQFLNTTGKPNVNKYGVTYSHGSLIANQFLTASPSLYYIRVLPDDATYANLVYLNVIRKKIKFGDTSSDTWVAVDYLNEQENLIRQTTDSTTQLVTAYENTPSISPLFIHLNNLTDINNLSDETILSNISYVPSIYLQTMFNDILYTFEVFSDNVKLVSTDSVHARPVYIANENNIYQLEIVLTNDPSDSNYDTATQVTGLQARYYLKATKLATKQTSDIVPDIYITNFKQDTTFKINISDDNTNPPKIVFETQKVQLTDIYEFVQLEEVFIGKGRGSSYNSIDFFFKPSFNKQDIYYMYLERKDENGTIINLGDPNYEIAFNPSIVDNNGSIFIKDIVDKYVNDITVYIDENEYDSKLYRLKMSLLQNSLKINDYRYSNGVYEVNDVITSITETTENGYYVVAYGAIDTLYTYPGHLILYNNGNITDIEELSEGSIIHTTNNDEMYVHLGNGLFNTLSSFSLFITLKDKLYLKNGSEGSLLNPDKTINTDIAKQLLSQAYSGILDNKVTNTQFYWMDLVFSGGYPKEVKDAAAQLAMQREDCIAILDIDDNPTPEAAVQARQKDYSYDSEFVALFDPYSKTYDEFSGRDIWVSPVYHMAYLIAMNDKINEVWYATAGYPEGEPTSIKELRYTPNITEEGQFYLNQINPFVQFRDGIVMWGNLTTYKQACAYQDINIVRCILYIKRTLVNYFRHSIFDENNYITWMEMENGANEFLKQVKEKRGLYDYNIKIYADNYMKRRKIAKADLILDPTRVLEKVFFSIMAK